MHPVLFRELIESDHPVPVPQQRLSRFGIVLLISADELIPLSFAGRAGVREGHPMKKLPGRGLLGLRQMIDHVDRLVVLAALFLPLGMLLGQRGPDAQVTVRDSQPSQLQAPSLEIAQNAAPGLLAFPLPVLTGQHHFAPV